MVSAMSNETRHVTKREFNALCEAVIDKTALALAQVDTLKRRVADLEKQVAGDKVVEWPLKSGRAA
jgi:hypothetical protein